MSATAGRRAFTRALGLGLVLGPLVAHGQSRGQPTRIGRLSPSSPAADGPLLSAFRKGMVELGWIEGQTFVIETRFAEGRPERLPGLAAELVRQGVDVILAGSNPGGLAARSATSRIPIVLVTTADPVGDKLVVSLARPGGNVTGVTALGHELNAKRLALLKEVVPEPRGSPSSSTRPPRTRRGPSWPSGTRWPGPWVWSSWCRRSGAPTTWLRRSRPWPAAGPRPSW